MAPALRSVRQGESGRHCKRWIIYRASFERRQSPVNSRTEPKSARAEPEAPKVAGSRSTTFHAGGSEPETIRFRTAVAATLGRLPPRLGVHSPIDRQPIPADKRPAPF